MMPRPSTRCPAELRPEQLVASAYREDDRAAAGDTRQAAIVAEPPRRQDLRQILAAAEQVDVALPGYRLIGVDFDGLGLDAPEPGTPLEHQQIPPVPVGAEQIGVDPDKPQAARSPPAACWLPGTWSHRH